MGKPYDTECVERLEKLFGTLRTYSLPTLKETFRSALHLKNKSFFDTYFSNYIEGTTFEVSEAEEIIFQKNLPKSRPKDAHDILENFLLVSDLNEMKKIPTTFDRFLNLVKERHHFILSKRPEASPGQFKQKPNRAGSTQFVTPEYVMGTLEKGFEFYLNLPSGIARAIYMMFLIADVHPFVDGNGRIARIMMNAELVSQGLVTIIIPTVYREDYLLTLRALSRNHRSEPLVRMLVKAQQFSNLDFASYPKTLKYLEDHHWFEEADDGKIIL